MTINTQTNLLIKRLQLSVEPSGLANTLDKDTKGTDVQIAVEKAPLLLFNWLTSPKKQKLSYRGSRRNLQFFCALNITYLLVVNKVR